MASAEELRSVRADGSPGKTFRFYVDNEIVEKDGVQTGGDHARVVDIEAASLDEAQKAFKPKKGEVVNQVVSVTFAQDAGG